MIRSRKGMYLTRYILVHGAWHGGWCWEEIVPGLEARGHVVVAPDLPGMGPPREGVASPTLDDWANFVADLARFGNEGAILVGHSRGGLVISRVAELAPEAVVRSVYVAAVLAGPGEALTDAVLHGRTEPMTPGAGIVVDPHSRHSRVADFATAKHMLFGHSPDAVAQRAFARLTEEPLAILSTRLDLSPERYGRVPRTYVECLRDVALPIEVQRAMYARQPCEIATLDTDHSPFYSMPAKLTDILHEVAHDTR